MALANGECIQDQYGHQYTLTIDEAHQYITGTVTGGQGVGHGFSPAVTSRAGLLIPGFMS